MATKDNSSGFLSKVAKFVRHPTKDWSELDQIGVESEPEQEKGYDKQALKEMIERKRRNDFVRGREFDQLRKLRRNIPVVSSDANGRPSFFLASTTGHNSDERASTIKKIDDIEAQMSKQWWKGKQGESAGRSENSGSGSLSETGKGKVSEAVAAGSAATEFEQTRPPESLLLTEPGKGRAYATTQPIGLSEDTLARADAQSMMEFGNFGSNPSDTGAKDFSLSGLFSIDLGDSPVDPDTEEAAIRFANRDDAGAEAGLLAALRSDKVRPESAKAWSAALFDLYRATGQQDKFERMAIECAERFGQPAPSWFSTPELLGNTASAGGPVAWVCPEQLDLPALQALRAILGQTPAPWHLDWRALRGITAEAGQSLSELFAQWCEQPVTLHFSGIDELVDALRSCTPSGDRQVAMFWWRLRLDALRILHLQDEFELAALDFCVVHELSPPPWENPRCVCVGEDMNPSQVPSNDAQTEPMGLATLPATVLELRGEVLGEASESLGKLLAGSAVAQNVVISCDRLIRVDFSAAGSILNWVMAREAEGCQVQFRDVPCLVSAFFNVIGINEHAKVVLRSN
jgi:hypothetical protein